MAPRSNKRDNKRRDGKRDQNKLRTGRRRRRRVCVLCAEKTNVIDYKDAGGLRKFISDRGKILPCRASGSCAKHQRVIAQAVKRARSMGLIPYTIE